jgi:hypothetical protein
LLAKLPCPGTYKRHAKLRQLILKDIAQTVIITTNATAELPAAAISSEADAADNRATPDTFKNNNPQDGNAANIYTHTANQADAKWPSKALTADVSIAEIRANQLPGQPLIAICSLVCPDFVRKIN